jgi:hypothetical protein
MSWLIPTALTVAAIGALATVALHFIARSRPVAEPLPTARFIPDRAIHARTRSIALTDILLLLLRLAAVLLLGFAVAGPLFAAGGTVSRIIVADRSRSVANVDAVRDSVRAYLRQGDQLIAFDSSASLARTTTMDSIVATSARGSLSAAVSSATRAGVRAAASADSAELVIVSPLTGDEVDAATLKIRAAWPGRIRLVRIAAAGATERPARVDVRSSENDAVAAGLSLLPALGAPVRVVRGRTTPDDSAWAREGHVLVHWPAAESDVDSPRRASIDAIGGITAGGATLVGRFPRPWTLTGHAVARWADGQPAAVEAVFGRGCVRDVSLLVDESSDLTLREAFRVLARELLAPCEDRRAGPTVDSASVAAIAGTGSLASSAALRDKMTEKSRWTPWLLVAAALALIAELSVRRTSSRFA